MSFTYNEDGIRTSKTASGVTHTYHLNGSQIIAEEWDGKLAVYLYDFSGAPIGMMYRETSYAADTFDVFWFESNVHGDIVAVYSSSGTKVAAYTYSDAWGNHSVAYSNGGGSTVAQYNPFRYRGYYYDTDLGMYYLNSRYYDSKICRFINADSYVSTGQSLTGNNMFAYCDNNPVMRYDSAGEYSAEIMGDRNPLDDFIRDGASSGGYNGGVSSIGPGSAYYNYSVYSQTSSYNASLGGYHTSSVSSGVVNPYYYYVPGGVSVNDSMATDNYVSRGSTGRTEPLNLSEKLAMEQVKANPIGESIKLNMTMNDPRWPASKGWVKMGANINTIEIHFVFNSRMNVFDDFKFVEKK